MSNSLPFKKHFKLLERWTMKYPILALITIPVFLISILILASLLLIAIILHAPGDIVTSISKRIKRR